MELASAIKIQLGFPDAQRSKAVALFDSAFGAKLSIAIPDTERRLMFLQTSFDPEHCFVAMADGEVVGIAGFKTATGSLSGDATFQDLVAVLGLAKALRAAVILTLFSRKLSAGQLLMDGIAVSPQVRGRGIGSLLLRHLIEFARSQGYQTLRLDVIDTNASARRLYERLGFVAINTAKFEYLRWLLGFGAATTLVYRIGVGK